MALDTTIAYLARDKIFGKEKAFDTDFPVSHVPGARRTNHTTEEKWVKVHEITEPHDWDLNTHGFCVVRAETHLNPQDIWTRKKEIQKSYWVQIERLLEERFPEYSRIESYDLTIRSRDTDFPKNERVYVETHEQPATKPHADVSQRGSLKELMHVFPGQEKYWKGKDYDIINVWRPLIGPNDDWPLAICDWTTVDQENDILLNDGIRRDRVDENSLLHHNEAHRWYYIKNQTPSDFFVFRNADSMGRRPRKLVTLQPNPLQWRCCFAHVAQLWRLDDGRPKGRSGSKGPRACLPHIADEADARVVPANIHLTLEGTAEDVVYRPGPGDLPRFHSSDQPRSFEDGTTTPGVGSTFGDLVHRQLFELCGARATDTRECHAKLA
ncbi:hypothetical protein N7522_005036 [Penicillium canescens]|nr:hypothetical protein N7522_005036 [Penicillium canescens]KAJ6161733.1 hypothetical protein N7485_009963 [Penicillium canescens]